MMADLIAKTAKFLQPTLASWNFNARPLVIGISGPQGSGKTYLSSKLHQYLNEEYSNLNTIVISVDDLYLTNAEQTKLTKNTQNPLLRGRGLPGTHDVSTAYTKLTKLINKDVGFRIPTYDKSAFGGLGDRDVESKWISINEKPADIVIFEGWFVGFQPIEDDDTFKAKIESSELLKSYDPEHLAEINTFLDEFIKVWNLFDLGIVYSTENIHNVYQWRIEQEHDLISKKGSGMTDEEVKKFVERYMVVYELYYKEFVENGFSEALQNFKIQIDSNRSITDTITF